MLTCRAGREGRGASALFESAEAAFYASSRENISSASSTRWCAGGNTHLWPERYCTGGHPVGIPAHIHACTISPKDRARSCILPNLFGYPGSFVTIDIGRRSENERRSVVPTAQRHAKFLRYQAMKRAMSDPSIDLKTLTMGPVTSICACRPRGWMSARCAWSSTPRWRRWSRRCRSLPVLLCLDEFAVMGRQENWLPMPPLPWPDFRFVCG
jgi:hypothetical protein